MRTFPKMLFVAICLASACSEKSEQENTAKPEALTAIPISELGKVGERVQQLGSGAPTDLAGDGIPEAQMTRDQEGGIQFETVAADGNVDYIYKRSANGASHTLADVNEDGMTDYHQDSYVDEKGRRSKIVYQYDFNFDGYQVVRGEFFAHIYEPSITFNNYKVGVNTACIKKLPEYDYVQILVNPEDKKLAVRPCSEDEKDSFRWCSGTKKRSPKQITCRMFFAKVISLMDWNPNYRYKLLGKLVRSGEELLFIFDLNSPEIYERTIKEDGKVKASRKPLFPESWQTQFGLPVSEHKKAMQINFFDDYAVFGLQEELKPTRKTESETKEATYEQLNLTTVTGNSTKQYPTDNSGY